MSEITQKIKTYCVDLIKVQTNKTFSAATNYLTNLADNAAHPNDKVLYIETVQDVSFGRKKALNVFTESLETAFDDLTRSPGKTQPKKTGGIDASNSQGTQDLEEKLALEMMINTSRSRSELPMQSIIRRLNGLMGDDWIQNHQNPLESDVIIKAWLLAVQSMKLPVKGNLALLGLLDSELLQLLPLIYEKIDAYLASLSIGSSSRANQSKPVFKSDDDYELTFSDIDEPNVIPDFTRAFTTSQDSGSGSRLTPDAEQNVPEAELRTSELITLLDSLQRNREIDGCDFYAGNYLLDYRSLLQSFDAVPEGELNPWTIGQINDDVIDMTQLLFSFIMEDEHLPEDIRYHVSRLQIPYLKLALQDKSIFADKKHPARQLLNDLAESISLWDPSHSGGLDLLLGETIQVIDEIIADYKTDTQLFDRLQQRFSHFLAGDEHIDKVMQHRQKETANKTLKADNARLYIESTLATICEGKRVPLVINRILETLWSKVLFLEFVKSGQHSKNFIHFVETFEMLVDSVQAKYSSGSRKKMAQQLPDLIRRLKEGFLTISVAAFETVDIFRELQECHLRVLKERPEHEEETKFEVSDEDYASFKQEQGAISEWNRTDLENALLEESIERSLSRSDKGYDDFYENRNVFSSAADLVQDATFVRAVREREHLDLELKEARDAYEVALKEHQNTKGRVADSSDSDDFMTQFFQDPEFIQKQYQSKSDLSASSQSPLQKNTVDVEVEDNVFEAIDGDSIATVLTESAQSQTQRDNTANLASFDPLSKTTDSADGDGNKRDDIADRAQGAIGAIETIDQLGEEQVAELVERLKVGLWVDLLQVDGRSERAKIMAIIPTVGKYIFGDSRGKKLADFNKKTLHEALKTGRIRVREEDNVFDKTLESVIANLRMMKKAADD